MDDTRLLRKAKSDISKQVDDEDMSEKLVECECCGLKEECSPNYLHKVKANYYGMWVCGLCSEAIKEKLIHSSQRLSMKDALISQKQFCENFNKSIRSNPKLSLAYALGDIAKRSSICRRSSMEEQRESTSSLKLARCASCLPRIGINNQEKS